MQRQSSKEYAARFAGKPDVQREYRLGLSNGQVQVPIVRIVRIDGRMNRPFDDVLFRVGQNHSRDPDLACLRDRRPAPLPLNMESPAFFTGVAFASVLLCAGLAIGLYVGRRREAYEHPSPNNDQMIRTLENMFHWTHGFANDMSQYRTVVQGVADRFREADDDSKSSPATYGLLDKMVEANESLENRLVTAESTLKKQAAEISAYMSEARTDALTGLPNRRAFDDELERRLSEWCRHGTPLSIMLVDIDHFKKFNDQYGHQTGDAVLAEVAKTLCDTMRKSDLVARYGGEEFAMILPNSGTREACQAAERARHAVCREEFDYRGRGLHVTISCGAAEAQSGESVGRLIKRADKALYASKHAGRNCSHMHNGRESRLIEKQPSTEAEHTAPAHELESQFTQVCDDLRQRLNEIASGD